MSWPWNLCQELTQGTVIENGTTRYIGYGFLLVFYSNFVPKMHCFEIFDFKSAVTLKTRLEVRQFDRAHVTSYWRSIVTMALSRVVSEIFNVEKCRDLEIRVKRHSRSSEPTRIDLPPDFLLTFNSNHWPTSHRFRDRRRFLSKIAKFSHRVSFAPSWRGSPWNWVKGKR